MHLVQAVIGEPSHYNSVILPGICAITVSHRLYLEVTAPLGDLVELTVDSF
jgi:hypothetical protein